MHQNRGVVSAFASVCVDSEERTRIEVPFFHLLLLYPFQRVVGSKVEVWKCNLAETVSGGVRGSMRTAAQRVFLFLH